MSSLSHMKNRADASGMTLVEVIFVVALFSMLMFVISDSVDTLYKANENTISQAYQIDSAQRGIGVFVKDLREMTFADNGAYPVVILEEHILGFYSDIDQDDSVEYIEFELVATTTFVKRIYNASSTSGTGYETTPDETIVISRYIQNSEQATSTFYYFDNAGNQVVGAAAAADVRYITARLIVDIDPSREPKEFILRSSAALRNLNENL
ncbi:MAG: type II secretory pathway pseudopilin PulG [Candidatus Azotimanducaceae bacterium]|jgi:type II secretory pathway pseudopilin PulG